ncbi:MAG TPA: tRNA (adenosine(37)-N6)-threonylcarbamoyltransferase complex dimerization subunit type 1 TsaB [Phycisphaerae bacterium]|nr:tRNA (adenosine(37)-N6)-threonylcarbamoyltransferase complex dimerization subunit type 1 TsaB [Phycisphaerae bacterium]
MKPPVSIAIETSCRVGGVALGRGDELLAVVPFDASARHAVQLVARLDVMLRDADLRAEDLDEVYVSAGPGSFTGLRVGVTVARTLAQASPRLRCVAVPTAQAVAENARDFPWQHLGVVFDSKDDLIYAVQFARRDGRIVPAAEPAVCTVAEFLAAAPRPLTLTGEGLGYHDLRAEGVTLLDESLRLPTPEGVWRVGRRLADEGQFTEYHHLLPLYTRHPEAVRLWEQRHGPDA